VFREQLVFKEALVSKVFRGYKASKAFKDLRAIQEP
jgi:hypothetical protein